ncbi:MAG: DNA polymerase IV [Spirochaetes bacterium]|nr:DNA polymerase IV [Spirochaetota bacterium]
MDAFYASVEQRDNPSLRGKPVVVGGNPKGRGVVCTASYEARKFGVHSAMAMAVAVKRCPHAVCIKPDFTKYSAISKALIAIYREYTDLVEPLSLDECYLDVTENKKNIGTATAIAKEIRQRIKDELKLTASAGVAPNKFLAKIASDIRKPDGLFVIKPHQVDAFMKTLDIKNIWGVGKVTRERMYGMGLHTCADLQAMSRSELTRRFGKFGLELYSFCRGIDERPVYPTHVRKSVGSETTFPEDSTDIAFIEQKLKDEIVTVAEHLMRKNMTGRTVTLKVKYGDFTTITRRMTLDRYVNSTDDIFAACKKLFPDTEIGKRPVRLIGATVSNFGQEEDGGLPGV